VPPRAFLVIRGFHGPPIVSQDANKAMPMGFTDRIIQGNRNAWNSTNPRTIQKLPTRNGILGNVDGYVDAHFAVSVDAKHPALKMVLANAVGPVGNTMVQEAYAARAVNGAELYRMRNKRDTDSVGQISYSD
jgi:hypothetical protein